MTVYIPPTLLHTSQESSNTMSASAVGIFVVVILVVAFGLTVSWLQFRNDLVAKPKENGDAVDNNYDINASLQSVSVKSKTIGAVVLIFSGIFFFLYLSIVYPMTSLVAKESMNKNQQKTD